MSSSSLADDAGGEELGPGLHGSHRPRAGAGLELFRDHGVAKPEHRGNYLLKSFLNLKGLPECCCVEPIVYSGIQTLIIICIF